MSTQLLTTRWGQPPRRYHKDQHEIRTSKCRGRLMDCGRRSGKTLLSVEILVSRLLDWTPGCPQMRYVCAAPIQEQANEIYWDLLLGLIPEEWIPGGRDGDHVSLSSRNIKLANGANIKVAGLDKPHRIEGKWLNGFVGTEMSDMRPGTFAKSIWPMLTDFHGWYILEGVPKRQGIGAVEFKELCDKVDRGDYEDCIHRHWSARTIMDPKEVKVLQQNLSKEDFQEQVEAQWLKSGGAVFYAFSKEHNASKPCNYRPEIPIGVGQDFNRTPMSWVLFHVLGEKMEVFDELVFNNTVTEKTLDLLWSKYSNHKTGWRFYGDASGRNARTGSTNKDFSDYTIIANDPRFIKAGRTLHYPPSNPSRHDRFAATNARLCSAAGVNHVYIDPKCINLIKDLEMRAYIPNTMELPSHEGMLGHISDAFSYPIYKLWPLKFNVGKGYNRIYTSEGNVPMWPAQPDPAREAITAIR